MLSNILVPGDSAAAQLIPACIERPYGQSYTGTATVNPPANTMSATLTVVAGAVLVTTPSGTFTAPTGSSFSWGEGNSEVMNTTGFTFAGTTAGASYILHGETCA